MNPRPRSELVARELLCSLVRLLVGAVPANGVSTTTAQAIFFANHSSHLDTVVLLAALPLRWRMRVRPVAAMDYWGKGRIRRWIAERVLNVVFIDRHGKVGKDALAPVREALQEGASLIFFPEGTRHNGALPDEFKSGIFRLAEEFPRIALVPTYLENPNRTLPKGSLLVLPLINRVHFGADLSRIAEESKPAFLTRARQAVCELAPHQFSSSPK